MRPAILLHADTFGAISFIILLSMAAILIGSVIYSQRTYDVQIATAIILAVVFNVVVLVFRILTDHSLVSDENSWHNQAIAVSNSITGASEILDGELARGKEGYAWLVGGFYSISGPAPLVPIVLNILLYALLIPILGVITGILGEELGFTEEQGVRAVKFAVYFISLAPVIVFWSPRMLREIISMFLISLSVMCLLLFLKSKQFRYFIGLVIAVALMTTIRAQIGAGLAAGLTMGFVIVWTMKLRGMVARAAFVVPTFLALFFLTWSYVNTTRDLSVESTARQNKYLADANSAFSGADELQGADSIVDIVLFNLPKVLFGPFPNELNSSSVMLLAAISNVFWIIALIFAGGIFARRQKYSTNQDSFVGGVKIRWRAVLVVTAIFFTFIGMLSINAGNYGLVIRMRLMPFVVLIPLAGLGFAMLKEQRSYSLLGQRSGKVSPQA